MTSLLHTRIRRFPHTGALGLLLTLFAVGCGGGGGETSSIIQPVSPNGTRPEITSLSPANTRVGTKTLSLRISGRNFASGAKVRWNGIERLTTYMSSSSLTADIPSSDLRMAGIARITVANPPPQSLVSNEASFTINNPVPVLHTLDPIRLTAGSPATTLALYGENFVLDSIVRINGSSRSGSYLNSTRLMVILTAADLAAAQGLPIQIYNPPPGGGTSGAIALELTPPGIRVETRSLPPAASGRTYDYTLRAAGGIAPYSWTVESGSLPAGLSLSTTGRITGTAPGLASDSSFPFTVRVIDSIASMIDQPLAVSVRNERLGRNDVCGPATTSPLTNGILRASISPYGDIDVYRFQAGAGARISAEIRAQRLTETDNVPSSSVFLDSYLEILNADCVTIAHNDDLELGIILDSRITDFAVPAAGTYYLRISDLRGDGRPDFLYNLELSGAD